MTPIEPGMLVECIDDEWNGASVVDVPAGPPTLGSRWFVIRVHTQTYPMLGTFNFLELRGRSPFAFWEEHFKPIDGEFEKLIRLEFECYEMAG